MSELVESAHGAAERLPARTLSVSLIDDDGWKHARSGIDVTRETTVFYWEGAELFRGIIMQQSRARKRPDHQGLRCGYLPVEQQRSFCYKQKRRPKSSGLLRPIPDSGTDVATLAIISELPKAKTTACDVILDALSLTFKATGIRHYVTSADETELIKRKTASCNGWWKPAEPISYDYTLHREGENPHKAAV
ncbi:MAG: hypothetical protein ACLSG5_07850 [Oscillospiraceae bacterium]